MKNINFLFLISMFFSSVFYIINDQVVVSNKSLNNSSKSESVKNDNQKYKIEDFCEDYYGLDRELKNDKLVLSIFDIFNNNDNIDVTIKIFKKN